MNLDTISIVPFIHAPTKINLLQDEDKEAVYKRYLKGVYACSSRHKLPGVVRVGGGEILFIKRGSFMQPENPHEPEEIHLSGLRAHYGWRCKFCHGDPGYTSALTFMASCFPQTGSLGQTTYSISMNTGVPGLSTFTVHQPSLELMREWA